MESSSPSKGQLRKQILQHEKARVRILYRLSVMLRWMPDVLENDGLREHQGEAVWQRKIRLLRLSKSILDRRFSIAHARTSIESGEGYA